MPLKIDDKVNVILKKQSIENYLDKLVSHCQTNYAYLREAVGSTALKNILRLSLNHAKQNGFTQQDTTRFYIDLMILLGAKFRDDPQYSWIKKIFDDYHDFTELTIAEVLYFDVIPFLEKSYGEGLCNRGEIFKKLDDYLKKQPLKPSTSTIPIDVNKDYIKKEVVNSLNEIVQAKFEATKEDNFEKLLTFGLDRAQKHLHMNHPEEITTSIVLMFILGSYFDEDPFITGTEKNLIREFEENYDSLRFNTIYEKFCFQFNWLPLLIKINTNEINQA